MKSSIAPQVIDPGKMLVKINAFAEIMPFNAMA